MCEGVCKLVQHFVSSAIGAINLTLGVGLRSKKNAHIPPSLFSPLSEDAVGTATRWQGSPHPVAWKSLPCGGLVVMQRGTSLGINTGRGDATEAF